MSSEEQDAAFRELAADREEYMMSGLAESDLTEDPLDLFARWFTQAREAGTYAPTAMVVSSVDEHGAPSSRTVLLKGVDEGRFVFYTNLSSRKGHELQANHQCALLFPWLQLQRQVRVEGSALELPRRTAEAYFASRPRGSQLGAWASAQSSVVADRAELEDAYAEVERRFEGQDVPCPPQWGGFAVEPAVVEFWQGRGARMHDRLVYRRLPGQGWETSRLAP